MTSNLFGLEEVINFDVGGKRLTKQIIQWVTPCFKSNISFPLCEEMSLTSIQIIADEYFNSLNPIAEKISCDVASTKEAYEDLWHTLTYKDQSQVIDDTIIHPEAVLKYSFYPQNEPEIEYFPRLRLQTGDKYIIDDDGGMKSSVTGFTWRDEHSAPFSWMTRSQLNLTVFTENGTEKKPLNGMKNTVCGVQPKSKLTPSKKVQLPPTNESFIDPPSIVLGGSTSKLASTIGSKLKFPPKSSTGNDSNLLTKLKNKTAVLKIQSLKSAVSKTGSSNSSRKDDESELESLVKLKGNTVVVPSSSITKPVVVSKPAISKPKTPPPPPPSKPKAPSEPVTDPERKALLEDSSMEELVPKLTNEENPTFIEEANTSLDDLQEFNIELSGGDGVPKTGFDFLDNW